MSEELSLGCQARVTANPFSAAEPLNTNREGSYMVRNALWMQHKGDCTSTVPKQSYHECGWVKRLLLLYERAEMPLGVTRIRVERMYSIDLMKSLP